MCPLRACHAGMNPPRNITPIHVHCSTNFKAPTSPLNESRLQVNIDSILFIYFIVIYYLGLIFLRLLTNDTKKQK